MWVDSGIRARPMATTPNGKLLPVAPRFWRAASCVDFAQGTLEIGDQLGEGQFRRHLVTTHKHIVPAVAPVFGQHDAGNFAQAPFGAVAGDGVADLLGTSETDANAGGFIRATFAGLQVDAGGALSAGGAGADKVAALFQDVQTNENRRSACVSGSRRFQMSQTGKVALTRSTSRGLWRDGC